MLFGGILILPLIVFVYILIFIQKSFEALWENK